MTLSGIAAYFLVYMSYQIILKHLQQTFTYIKQVFYSKMKLCSKRVLPFG